MGREVTANWAAVTDLMSATDLSLRPGPGEMHGLIDCDREAPLADAG